MRRATIDDHLDSDDAAMVRQLLRPVHRRLVLQLLLHLGLRAGAALLVVAALAVLTDHLLTDQRLDAQQAASAGALTLGLLVLVVTMLMLRRRWPTMAQAARHADTMLRLEERLTTAFEFSHEQGEIYRLQRRELQAAVQSQRLAASVQFRAPRLEVAAVVAALVLLGAALFTANPRAEAQREAALRRAPLRAAAAQVRSLAAQQATPVSRGGPPAQGNAALLHTLQQQLAHAGSTAQALQALSGAQHKLAATAAHDAAASDGLQQLAAALHGGTTTQLAAALSSNSAQQTAQALKNLAQKASGMQAPARQQLAQQLQRAANKSAGPLSDTLRQTARALTDSDQPAVQQALATLSQQTSAAEQMKAAGSAAAQTLHALGQIKQQLASAGSQAQRGTQPPRSAAPPPGTTPSAAQPSASAQGAAAHGARQQPGSTTGGHVTGTGQAGRTSLASGKHSGGVTGKAQQATGKRVAASAAAPASGPNGTSSAAAGSTGGAAGSAAAAAGGGSAKSSTGGAGGHGGGSGSAHSGSGGKYEQVYLPATQSAGPGTVLNAGAGTAVSIQSTAFKQGVARYGNAASHALGRMALPQGLQSTVKQYFDSLDQNG